MNRDELTSLMEKPESQTLDWKADFPEALRAAEASRDRQAGKGALLKDLLAMANGLERDEGLIIYGVKDHRRGREVIGLSRSWDDASFQDWVRNAVEPPIDLAYSEVAWDSEIFVGVFRIRVHPEGPHVAKRTVGGLHKGQVWLRVGSQNTVALQQELRTLFSSVEPIISDNPRGPVVNKVTDYYRERGREVVKPSYTKQLDNLEQGYELALYPGTRRPVVLKNPLTGQPELILMLRPTESADG